MTRGGQVQSVAWQWHRLFRGGTVAGFTEGELLDRFLTKRDEVAFEALVSRHGPMVLAVCRRILTEPSDVEDAFQATFLVLVRRAGSIRDRERLGNWLYGVAHRVAARARADAARRRAREGADLKCAGDGPLPISLSEEFTALHDEVRRLPEKYRAAVVLCDLEGNTHEAAAQLLGWPVGSVKGRLFRARNLLRERLVRRGVSLSATAIGTALGGDVRASILAPALLDSTVKAGAGVAAGQALGAGLVSASALTLFQGVHQAMFFSKLKTAGLIAAGAVMAGSGAIAYQGGGIATNSGQGDAVVKEVETPAGSPRSIEKPEVNPTANDDGHTLSLHDAYLDRTRLARELYDATLSFYREGRGEGPERVIEASNKWMQAEQDFAASKQDQIRSAQAHLERMTSLAELEKARLDAGIGSLPAYREAQYAVADAKLGLLRVDGREKPFPQRKYVDIPTRVTEIASRPGRGPENPPTALSLGLGVMPGPGMMGLKSTKGGSSNQASSDRGLEREDDEDQLQNALIRQALLKPMPMPFGQPTPVEDVLKYIKQATITPTLPVGLPIYIDPKALQKLEKRDVVIDIEGVRLKTTLRLVLSQLDLGYYIRDGLLMIESRSKPDFLEASQEELNIPSVPDPDKEPQREPSGIPAENQPVPSDPNLSGPPSPG